MGTAVYAARRFNRERRPVYKPEPIKVRSYMSLLEATKRVASTMSNDDLWLAVRTIGQWKLELRQRALEVGSIDGFAFRRLYATLYEVNRRIDELLTELGDRPSFQKR